jgi:hypothetical protein
VTGKRVKVKVLWVISLVLIVGALGLHITALRAAGNGAMAMSRIMAINVEDQEQARAEARRFARRADAFLLAGWIAAGLSIVSLFFSSRRAEPAPRSVVYALLALYAILQFAVV